MSTARVRKMLAILAILAFLASLIPLLAIAQYDYPSSDDFAFSKSAADAWRDSRSLAAVFAAAAKRTAGVYQSTQGTFSAIFLMTLQPGIWNIRYYGLTAAINLMALTIGAILLFSVIWKRFYHTDWAGTVVLTLLPTAAMIQFVPSAVDAFYWYNGSVFYTAFHGVYLAFTALLLRFYFRTPGRKRNLLYYIFLPLLGAVLGGGNLATCLICAVTSLGIIAGACSKKRRDWLPIAAVFVFLAAFSINLLSPGNAARMADVADHPGVGQPIGAVIRAMGDSFTYSVKWSKAPFLVLSALAVPFLFTAAKPGVLPARYPALVTAGAYCLLGVGFAVPEYGQGFFGPLRMINVNYYMFVILFYLVLSQWIAWIQRIYAEACEQRQLDGPGVLAAVSSHLRRYSAAFIAGWIILFGIACLGTKEVASLIAVKSLYNGTARQYGEQMQAVINTLEDPTQDIVTVSEPTVKPLLLYFHDQTPEEWGQLLQGYYGKSHVTVIPADPAS